MRRLALALLVAAVAASAALVTTSPATAATPCWHLVINDWYAHDTLKNTYPIHCYHEALQHLPNDIKSYADAADRINAAMQAAIIAAQKNGGTNPPTTTPGGTEPAQTTTTGTTPTDTDTQTETTKTSPAGPGGTDTTGGSAPGDGADTSPVPQAITNIGPASASSVPVPLIILGVLALLLLAAGAAGVVARKLQERRLPATPGGTPPSDPPATA